VQADGLVDLCAPAGPTGAAADQLLQQDRRQFPRLVDER
jgi:hypothetical protein